MAELDDVVNAINSLRNSLEKERTGTSAKTAEELELENAMLKERSKLLLEEIAAEEELAKKEQLRRERMNVIAELVKRSNRSNEKKAKILADLERRQKKNTKATEKAIEAEEKQAEAVDEVIGSLSSFINVSKSYEKSLFGQIKAIKGNTEAQEQLGKKIKENFKISKVAYSEASRLAPVAAAFVKKALFEVDSGLAGFNRATGMLSMFGKQLVETGTPLRQYGVQISDLGDALNTLGQEFPLAELGESATQVASQFALYEKFGVSAQSSAAAFTTLTRSLGSTTTEAQRTLEGVAALGIELGMGAGRLTEDFAQALPRLAIYGKQAEKIFANIAVTSSKLGLSVDDIMGLAEGLQTFESSAQAAGQLNAILGGGFIDNLELMEAAFENPAEAALMIKDAFATAGASLDTMGPAAIKAAAQAAGFGDANKFRRFIEGEISATEALGDDQLQGQLDANKLAKSSLTELEKISSAITQLPQTLLGGLIPGFKDMTAGTGALALGGAAVAGEVLPTLGSAFLLSRMFKGGTAAAPSAPGQAAGAAGMMGKLGGMGKFLKAGGALGTVALAGKDVIDFAQGDRSAGNTGALIGTGIGALAGLIAGPAGAMVGASLGNMAGQAIGSAFDSSMPAKKAAQTATQAAGQQSIEHKHVIEIIQDTNNAERFVKAVYRKDLSS